MKQAQKKKKKRSDPRNEDVLYKEIIYQKPSRI